MYDKKINLLPTEQKDFLFQQKAKLGAIALGITLILGVSGFELYLMELNNNVTTLTSEKSDVEQIKNTVSILNQEINQQDQLIRILQNQDFPMDDFLLTLSSQIPKHLWLYSVDGEDFQVIDQCQNANNTAQPTTANGTTSGTATTSTATATSGTTTANGATATSGTSGNCPPPTQSGQSGTTQPSSTTQSGTTAQSGSTTSSTSSSGQTTTQPQSSTTSTTQQTTTQQNGSTTAGQTGTTGSTTSNGTATQNKQTTSGQTNSNTSAIQAVQNNPKAHKTFTIRGAGTSPTEIGQFVQILNAKDYISKATLSSVEEYLANDQVYEAFEITVEGK